MGEVRTAKCSMTQPKFLLSGDVVQNIQRKGWGGGGDWGAGGHVHPSAGDTFSSAQSSDSSRKQEGNRPEELPPLDRFSSDEL